MDKLNLYDKILSPLVTEKTTNLSEQNKIVVFSESSGDKILPYKRNLSIMNISFPVLLLNFL